MKNVALTIMVIIVLVIVALTYDPSQDPTWHNCTAECAMNGCTFE